MSSKCARRQRRERTCPALPHTLPHTPPTNWQRAQTTHKPAGPHVQRRHRERRAPAVCCCCAGPPALSGAMGLLHVGQALLAKLWCGWQRRERAASTGKRGRARMPARGDKRAHTNRASPLAQKRAGVIRGHHSTRRPVLRACAARALTLSRRRASKATPNRTWLRQSIARAAQQAHAREANEGACAMGRVRKRARAGKRCVRRAMTGSGQCPAVRGPSNCAVRGTTPVAQAQSRRGERGRRFCCSVCLLAGSGSTHTLRCSMTAG